MIMPTRRDAMPFQALSNTKSCCRLARCRLARCWLARCWLAAVIAAVGAAGFAAVQAGFLQ
ncbi:MAG: hypothetical protein U1E05_17795, partial [Patescibacteria group bacterium]|nr:hypothetical protein [Patescibacteria group bacterium]